MSNPLHCLLLARKIDRSRAKEEVNVGRTSPSPLRGGSRAKASRGGGSKIAFSIGVIDDASTPTRPSLRDGHPPRKGEGSESPLLVTCDARCARYATLGSSSPLA